MDLLASEYGWSKQEILQDTFPEEFFALSRQIKARHIDEAILQTSIATQPHRNTEDAKEWIEGLMSQRRFFRGADKVPETLDVSAFNAFRQQTMQDSRLIRAK